MRLLLVFVVLMTSATLSAEETMLQCDFADGGLFFHLRINADGESVLFLASATTTRNGVVETTKDHYQIVLPELSQFYEARININRYSGEMNYEIGHPPFTSNPDNVVIEGICKKIAVNPKL